jgi:DNA-binding transcriptional MerR regulator/methylmalonyl-CoA mutase cobalamin-binding subunit
MAYPIQVVARKTGLSQGTLRAWERRYDGIRPGRDNTGRRQYSEELTEKLGLLARLVRVGYRIGQIASLDAAQLRGMVEETEQFAEPAEIPATDVSVPHAVSAVSTFDDVTLYRILEEGVASYGRLDLIDQFIFPLVHEIESKVEAGTFQHVHLSFLYCALRTVLSQLLVTVRDAPGRPTALLISPAAHSQDLGIVASAIHADAAGWRPVLLGVDVKAEEVAEALHVTGARSVIVGVGSNRYDLVLMNELVRLRKSVPEEMPVYFGGRIPPRLVEDLQDAGLTYLRSMDELRDRLEQFAEGS